MNRIKFIIYKYLPFSNYILNSERYCKDKKIFFLVSTGDEK